MVFLPRTNFLANRSPVRGGVRANSGELRRTPVNVRRTPANVRRSSAECRCWRTDGEFARSSREFARVRPSSREFAANDSSPGILPIVGLSLNLSVLHVKTLELELRDLG